MSADSGSSETTEPIRITVEQAASGQWVTPPVDYVDPVRRFCAYTGRPIARGYWQVIAAGQEVAFCDREAAIRYAAHRERPEPTAST